MGTVAAGAEWAAFSPWRRAWFPWTRSYRPGGAPASAMRRVGVPRILPEGEKPESRGHRAERLRRARIRHEVKMAREKAREEVESEAWVKERARLENLAKSSRLTHRAVALDHELQVAAQELQDLCVGVVDLELDVDGVGLVQRLREGEAGDVELGGSESVGQRSV